MTTLENARAAADYMQRYARGFRSRHVELAKSVNPEEGYGRGEDVISAHRIALFLHERVQALFNPCTIPERYGSAADFRDELEGFDLELVQRESKLRDDIEVAFSTKRQPPRDFGDGHRRRQRMSLDGSRGARTHGDTAVAGGRGHVPDP